MARARKSGIDEVVIKSGSETSVKKVSKKTAKSPMPPATRSSGSKSGY